METLKLETLKPRPEATWLAAALGLWCAAATLVPGWQLKAMLACPLIVGVLWWSALRSSRWLGLFFACLLLTPPIPGPVGDAGLHVAPVFALVGVFAGMLRLPQWRTSLSPLTLAFGLFLAVLLVSVALASLYSGESVALGSLLRVGLFGISVYIFLYASDGPGQTAASARRFTAFLFALACAAGVFACADFYFQFPAPAGFGAQYVWLDEGVFRRAQGLFYEASTLGNFCAFFLVMIAVALLRREESPCPRLLLMAGGGVFAIALILSYSRGSILNIIAALIALAILRSAGRVRLWRPLAIAALVAVAAGVAVRFALPSFSASYWERLGNSLAYFWYSPDGVLSGRLNNWYVLADFLSREPWHAVFGIGYKTLAYSSYTGRPVIADNTYLSMLVETGLVGLGSFVILNAMILRYARRAAKSRLSSAAFFGEWIFCFWIGQLVQMFSGDLFTYWRVLPVYFWVLGTAVRQADAEG
jgi:O-antigen ligase